MKWGGILQLVSLAIAIVGTFHLMALQGPQEPQESTEAAIQETTRTLFDIKRACQDDIAYWESELERLRGLEPPPAPSPTLP